MTNVESVPPVIDLEAMLQPISEENPSGESLQYSGLYDELREARRADLNLDQGQWQTQLKVADYRKVIELAVPALTNQTKDLQITAWLSESLTREKGFAGLRDSLKLMTGLQQNFWETCFPEIDEGDQEGRANAIEWMDKQASESVERAPLTGGANLSIFDYEESKRFDMPDNFDSLSSEEQARVNELMAQAERENRITGELWRRAKTQTRRVFYEQLTVTIEECWEAYQTLNQVIEEKFDRNQTPGMTLLKKRLDAIRDLVKKLLQEKRQEEPDEVEAGAEGEGSATEGEAGTAGSAGGGVATATGAVRSRQDALKRLSDVADFFRKTEPHSPVSYLVQRAVKWGNMPLDNWLQEVIKDEAVLGQLRETLGFGGGAATESSDSTESSGSGW